MLTIVYFTDPICSACWGIEPQLRRLKLEYGAFFDLDYRMGGLLPDWSYNSGGISKPSDVAGHWDEVSRYYDMPIDGDVWLEDPLPSSYPPSIAFKAAQMQDEAKAVAFLRGLRELLFLEKKNITRWEFVQQAALSGSLDTSRLRRDFEGEAQQRFREDLALAQASGVRGFPTLIFRNGQNETVVIGGVKPYAAFEAAVTKLYPQAVKSDYDPSWTNLFSLFPTLTAREFSLLSDMNRSDAGIFLENLVSEGKLGRTITKNGNLYFRKNGK